MPRGRGRCCAWPRRQWARVGLHVGKQERGYDEAAGVSQDIDDVLPEGHGGVPGHAQGRGLLLGAAGGFQVPLAIYQRVLAALDLEAEPAAALGPDGKVQLGDPGFLCHS